MTRYAAHLNDTQREQASELQAKNSAGGYSFTLDRWKRLDRFLILGSEGGTYYVGERKLTKDNVNCIKECLAQDGIRTVNRIAEISDAGRAPKNDPAIFALALAASAADPKTRQAALSALPRVCRIGTHLFHFIQDVNQMRGFGRSLKRAVGAWYSGKTPEKLAYQAIKYQQRDGWSHRDALRLSHPKAPSEQHDAILRWITSGASSLTTERNLKSRSYGPTPGLPDIIGAFEEIHSGVDAKRALELIRTYHLPHECVPNELKDRPGIWEALLPGMGLTALLRNLAKMTNVGLLKPMSSAAQEVASRLTDKDALLKARVHPMAVLVAIKQYASGNGLRGSLTWDPVREVIDALDEAFYLSFCTVEPSDKRTLLGIDISSSMDASMIAGTNISAREAAAAMAMVTARTEGRWGAVGFATQLCNIPISPRQRLSDVVDVMRKLPMGGTDCSVPILWATKGRTEVDTFVILTDSETWAGNVHPHEALERYRKVTGIYAKLVVVGMTSTEFSIANPNDPGMLDVVGMDSAVPQMISDWSADRFTYSESGGVS